MTTSNANRPTEPTTDESEHSRRRDVDADRLDAVFDVLADARRRRVVRIVRDAADAWTVDALADALAAHESGRSDLERLGLSLRHVHLPKLDAANVVDYDPDRSSVRYERAPLVESILDQL
jgi:DNA-binding transcriptional ArsR family regulator